MILDLSPISAAAKAAAVPADGDYIQDGILHCGQCHTPKQCYIPEIPGVIGISGLQSCLCACEEAKYEAEHQAWEANQRRKQIEQLRINGISDRTIREYTFAADNGKNRELMAAAKRYADKWDRMYADNIGLLLWGNTGNGKTFAAACIANELMEKGVPVLVTSFARILNSLMGYSTGERNAYLDSLSAFKLLVIDDLGAERQSAFALEQVYNVIDTRYKRRQPLIVTTNLTMSEMKKPQSMDYQRIYDRVLEMCIPMHFTGESQRKEHSAYKIQLARELLRD